ncbi:hypothetical protein BBJ28_00013555, partial [Nothophytophthora sp. Chile5]
MNCPIPTTILAGWKRSLHGCLHKCGRGWWTADQKSSRTRDLATATQLYAPHSPTFQSAQKSPTMVSLSYRGAIATAAVGGLVLLPIAIHLSRSSRRLSVDEKQQRKRSTSTGGRRERRRAARLRSTLPVLENTLDLIRAASSVHDWMAGACRHFRGRPFVMKAFGLPDMLVVCTPQAFEDVLKTQFQNFPKGPFMCENMRDLLGEGIFAVDGGQWMHQRGIASSLFGMRELRDCMTNAIGRHTVALHDILKRASATNETVDLFKLFN